MADTQPFENTPVHCGGLAATRELLVWIGGDLCPYSLHRCTSSVSKGSCLSDKFSEVFFIVLMINGHGYYINDRRNTPRNSSRTLWPLKIVVVRDRGVSEYLGCIEGACEKARIFLTLLALDGLNAPLGIWTPARKLS